MPWFFYEIHILKQPLLLELLAYALTYIIYDCVSGSYMLFVFHFGTEKQEVFHQQQWLLTTEILIRHMLPGHRIWIAGMSTVV